MGLYAKAAILGAGGHGKVIAELLEALGCSEVVFFDNEWPILNSKGCWSVVGNENDYFERLKEYQCWAVAYTKNPERLTALARLNEKHANPPSLVHPKAILSNYCQIGFGSQICMGAMVQTDARIGQGVIINTGASVDHDCVLADGVQIGPGVRLAGGVHIGRGATIGTGAIVLPNINIGENATVGAGSVVLRNVPPNFTVVGVPAKTCES